MSSNPEARLPRSAVMILAGLTILSVGVYLLVSRLYFRTGFPLDDSWIHQTYARNLALHKEWSFQAGQPSGGSTAPFWSALLSIGYIIRLAPYIWTYILGAMALWATTIVVEFTVRSLVSTYRPRFPWAGAFIVLEWHLVWAAVSGMETSLYSLLVVVVTALLIRGARTPFRLGLLIGLSIWVRPDGITFLGPAVLTILLVEKTWRSRFQTLTSLGLGFGGLLALYLLFNLRLEGRLLPNTFYAKQTEYAVLIQLPILARLGRELLQPLIGAGIILLPGVGMNLVSSIRRRSWGTLACLVWFFGYLGLYAWRLPVVYQHARYIIPAMSVWFVLGLAGLFEFASQTRSKFHWALMPAWELTLGLVLLLFWGRGAYAYAQDVAVIESEMVTTAKWVSINLPPGALVAAHDIGAMGYFSQHKLVDLAGLVSPEVIPFIRDESRLASYMNERNVDYLVTFPSWYPVLTRGLTPIYTTGAPYSRSLGEDNMAVYHWIQPRASIY